MPIPSTLQMFLAGGVCGAVWWHLSYILGGTRPRPAKSLKWLGLTITPHVTYDAGRALWCFRERDGREFLSSSKAVMEQYLDRQDNQARGKRGGPCSS